MLNARASSSLRLMTLVPFTGFQEIGLTVLSFAVVVALLATIIMGLATLCDALQQEACSRLLT